jgi:hypothetical protein
MLPQYIVIILTILLIFLYLNYPDCNKKIEKMSQADILKNINMNMVIPFDDIKIPSVPIPKLILLEPGQTFELLDLPYCNEKFKVEYGSNTNYVQNDGKKVFQDMLKPYEQKATIGTEQQGLTQISWKKSFFTFNGKKVGLELHFAHTSPKNGKRIRVIFPLSLNSQSDSNKLIKETFANIKNTNTVKSTNTNTNTNTNKNNISDLNKLGRLNMLLKKPSDVPSLVKGSGNTGKLIEFNLCEPAKLLLEQKKFFFAETPSEELLLIAKPQAFDKTIGTTIMDNLQDPDYEIIKPVTK